MLTAVQWITTVNTISSETLILIFWFHTFLTRTLINPEHSPSHIYSNWKVYIVIPYHKYFLFLEIVTSLFKVNIVSNAVWAGVPDVPPSPTWALAASHTAGHVSLTTAPSFLTSVSSFCDSHEWGPWKMLAATRHQRLKILAQGLKLLFSEISETPKHYRLFTGPLFILRTKKYAEDDRILSYHVGTDLATSSLCAMHTTEWKSNCQSYLAEIPVSYNNN